MLQPIFFCLWLWRLVGVFGDEWKRVIEGDSVTLNTDLTEMKDDDQIQWMYGYEDTLIAEIKVTADRITVNDDVLDGRFRDRLKLDNQTGSLTITNITTKHTGRYKLETYYIGVESFFLTVIDEVSVTEGDSVTLNSDLTEMKDDDRILWWIEYTLIAEINKQFNRFTVNDDVLDGRFRDKLKLDNQTGSLTITNITTEHAGYFRLGIYNTKLSSKAFNVSVSESVHCCGSTEAVIRLVLSALVGVATVITLVYDIKIQKS